MLKFHAMITRRGLEGKLYADLNSDTTDSSPWRSGRASLREKSAAPIWQAGSTAVLETVAKRNYMHLLFPWVNLRISSVRTPFIVVLVRILGLRIPGRDWNRSSFCVIMRSLNKLHEMNAQQGGRIRKHGRTIERISVTLNTKGFYAKHCQMSLVSVRIGPKYSPPPRLHEFQICRNRFIKMIHYTKNWCIF